jgi:hypothetical protein
LQLSETLALLLEDLGFSSEATFNDGSSSSSAEAEAIALLIGFFFSLMLTSIPSQTGATVASQFATAAAALGSAPARRRKP